MAQLNITINIPDEKLPVLVAALNDVYPTNPPRTPAQAREFVKQLLILRLKSIYQNYLRKQYLESNSESDPLSLS